MRIRDRQRAKVYAWESAQRRRFGAGDTMTLDAGQALVASIWKAERARYGLGRKHVPELTGGHGPQRRGLAFIYGHRMSIPDHSLKPWVICHEVAHLLTGPKHEAHGPRFVGILIGLLARHATYDAVELLASAQLAKLRVSPQSIGALPARPQPEMAIAEKLLALAPVGDVDEAIELGLHWRQVRGHALQLVRAGRARWFRGKLHALPQVQALQEPST